jgi:hypothetical protein
MPPLPPVEAAVLLAGRPKFKFLLLPALPDRISQPPPPPPLAASAAVARCELAALPPRCAVMIAFCCHEWKRAGVVLGAWGK